MLMIRLQRIGRTNDPAFRVVILEKERAAKSGRILEQLGTYNPRSKAVTLDEGKIKEWIGKGAQPTGSVHNLLVDKGIITGKKVDVLPSRRPVEQGAGLPSQGGTEAVVAATAAAVVSEAVEEAAPEAAVEAAIVDAGAGATDGGSGGGE